MSRSCSVFGNVELCLPVYEEASGRDLLLIVTHDHAWALLRWESEESREGGGFTTAAAGRFHPVHGDAFPDAVLRAERAEGAVGCVQPMAEVKLALLDPSPPRQYTDPTAAAPEPP